MKGRVFMAVNNQTNGAQQPQKVFKTVDGPSLYDLCLAQLFAFDRQAPRRVTVTVAVQKTATEPTGLKKLNLQIFGIEYVSSRSSKGKLVVASEVIVLARDSDDTLVEFRYNPVLKSGDLTKWPTRRLDLSSRAIYPVIAGPLKYDIFFALMFAFDKKAPRRVSFTVEMPNDSSKLKLLDLQVLGIEYRGAAPCGKVMPIITSDLIILGLNVDGVLVEIRYQTGSSVGKLVKLI